MINAFTGKSCRQLVAEHANADDVEREAVQIAQQRRAEVDAADYSDDTVWVSLGDLDAIVDQGSVVVFTGTDGAGRIVTFAVDHRPARDLVEAVRAYEIEDEGPLPCYVEDWQILRRTDAVVV